MRGQINADVIRVSKPKEWFIEDALRIGQWGWAADTKEIVVRMPDGSYYFISGYDDTGIRELINDLANNVQNLDEIYLKLTGGTLTGDLEIRKLSPRLSLGILGAVSEAKIETIGNGTALTIESGLGNLNLKGRGVVYDSGVSGHTFRGGAGVTIDGRDLNVVNGRYLLNGQLFGGGSAPTPGNGKIDLVIGQAGREIHVGSFTVNQAGDTKIVLDSSNNSGANEGHLLSNVPHAIRVTGGTQNNPVVAGDGLVIPTNKMFLIVESSTVNNPVLRMSTPLTPRAFYVVNRFNQTIYLDLSATPGGTSMRFNIPGNSGIHFMISDLGFSNIIGSVVSFNTVS